MRPPQCSKCKEVLVEPRDRLKHKDKWWTNCFDCRSAHAIKWREKREALKTIPYASTQHLSASTHGLESTLISGPQPERQTKKRNHEHLFSSDLGSGKKTKSEQHLRRRTEEGCVECGRPTVKPWITGCGHLLCDSCHKNVMTHAADAGRVYGICKSCHKIFAHCYRLNSEEQVLKRPRISGKQSKYKVTAKISLLECSVCGEIKDPSHAVKLSACTHEPDTCSDCFCNWVTSQLESSAWDGIRCPSNNCQQKITHADFKKHASSEDFAR